METRFTPRNETLLVGAYEHLVKADAVASRLVCRLCLGDVAGSQPALFIRPRPGNAVQVETLGTGALYHLSCLRRAAVVSETCWYTGRQTMPVAGPPAAVVHRSADADLDFEEFGAFAEGMELEYVQKGCLWCRGHGRVPGVILNFAVPDVRQRFRLLHISCIDEMWAQEQPSNWREGPVPDPTSLLESFAELLQLT